MGLNISKADLEKLVGSEEMGWYDEKGHFCIIDTFKLIDFAIANPNFVLEDYQRHLKLKYVNDAQIFDEMYPPGKRVGALQNYLKFCEGLSELISCQSNSPIRTDSPIFTPVAQH